MMMAVPMPRKMTVTMQPGNAVDDEDDGIDDDNNFMMG